MLSKWRFSCSINGHVGPLIYVTIKSRMDIIFKHVVQSFLNTYLLVILFLESHQTTYHSNIGARFRQVIELGMSTFDIV